MRLETAKVLWAVGRERSYQDAKYGTPEARAMPLDEYMQIAQRELNEAFFALTEGNPNAAQCELLQVAAVIVACLERHGAVERTTSVYSENCHQ